MAKTAKGMAKKSGSGKQKPKRIKRSSKSAAAELDPIKHVVVLMMENRSFDQMLGSFNRMFPELDGIPTPPRSNVDTDGTVYLQEETRVRSQEDDPKHEYPDVLEQLKDNNSYFVYNFSENYPQGNDKAEIMNYYPLDFLPALHTLARDFAICDQWYASVPSSTWPNRFFAHSGTSLGWLQTGAPHIHLWNQPTIFDKLNEKKISWKIYYHDTPQSILLTHQLLHLNRYHYIDQLIEDAGRPESEFPSYIFIEPRYYWAPSPDNWDPGPGDFLPPNSDHVPGDVLNGERLIAMVFNALRSNADLWNSTLFVIVFDEHGGFYDHEGTPPAVPPEGRSQKPGEFGFQFDRLGVRVPALLISPWIDKGVVHTQFDHTSILRYLTDKWGLGALGARVAAANSLDPVIRKSGAPRADTIELITIPPDPQSVIAAQSERPKRMDRHHRGFVEFSEYLEDELRDDPAGKALRAQKLAPHPLNKWVVAMERFERFKKQMEEATPAQRKATVKRIEANIKRSTS